MNFYGARSTHRELHHLAMIMDGNRRWAKEKGLKSVVHRAEGVESVRTAAAFCLKKNISYLTLFMLSLENGANRDSSTLKYIFDLTVSTCADEVDALVEQGIRVRFIGRRDLFPARVMPSIEHVERATAGCTKLNLNLMFYYGAQQELVAATRNLARKVRAGTLDPESIDETTISNALLTAGMPPPDLIVRTGARGAVRLSNFLLFQAAYSELQFKDYFWPELTEQRLQDCLDEFYATQRNFGY